MTPADRKGDIFYTPSSTLGIQHGHVGLYHTRDSIVESIPSTGVRRIFYKSRNVEKNAVMQLVNTTQAREMLLQIGQIRVLGKMPILTTL